VRLHFGSMKHNGFYVNKIDDNEIIIEKHNHETNHNKNNTPTILKKTNKGRKTLRKQKFFIHTLNIGKIIDRP